MLNLFEINLALVLKSCNLDTRQIQFPYKTIFLTKLNNIVTQVDDEDNRLQDGTLIDLCGATLLWRSAEGLANSPVSTLFCVIICK